MQSIQLATNPEFQINKVSCFTSNHRLKSMLSWLFGRMEASETKTRRQSSKDETQEIRFARALVRGKRLCPSPPSSFPFGVNVRSWWLRTMVPKDLAKAGTGTSPARGVFGMSWVVGSSRLEPRTSMPINDADGVCELAFVA